jgi:septum formation protein
MIKYLLYFVKSKTVPMTSSPRPALVLASTSRYRQALLARLHLPFTVQAPDVDETPLPDETPRALALRLAKAKAQAVAATISGHAHIIGSDQVAALGSERFGKPGTRERAIAQLLRMRGQTVLFHTAVALYDTTTGTIAVEEVPTAVTFRADLTDEAIARYVDAETPFDCAGAAKIEALGITLVESVTSSDPTALIGLPLIATARLLRANGWPLP